MKIRIGCPSCYKTFDTLPNLNRHIAKKQHNSGLRITIPQFLKSVGIDIKFVSSTPLIIDESRSVQNQKTLNDQ